jgi:hypothetical protein
MVFVINLNFLDFMAASSGAAGWEPEGPTQSNQGRAPGRVRLSEIKSILETSCVKANI